MNAFRPPPGDYPATPGRDYESSLKGFRAMGGAEWMGLVMSLLRGGVLEPEEQRAFEVVRAEREKKSS